MWCLKGPEDFCVYILPNEKQSFGKLQSDVKLENDPTVSRLHAIVSVQQDEESDMQYKCIVSDLSKYGTYIIQNEERKKICRDEKYVLKPGNKIQFGLKHSIFIVSYYSFVIARSSLNTEDTDRLKYIANRYLGGSLTERWQSLCTHLTVPKQVLFTTKLACALASAKPIVTIEYWEAVSTAIKKSKELPKIENFLPIVKEEWLHANSELLLPKEERKTLFKGLSFVHFCTKQYFSYAQLIVAAGGKSCIYPTKKPLTPRDLTAKNAIVVQQSANDSSQFTQVIAADYPVIYHKLYTLKRRMISDTEIPLAILYYSTEKYCNPKFNFGTFLKSTNPTFSSSDVVIIEDTQEVSKGKLASSTNKWQGMIPETCDSLNDRNPSIANDISSVKTNMRQHIIPESCDLHENSAMNIPSTSSNTDKEPSVAKTCYFQENAIIKNVFDYDISKERGDFETAASPKRSSTCNRQQGIIEVSNFRKRNITSYNEQQSHIPESCNSYENSRKKTLFHAVTSNNDITKQNRLFYEVAIKPSYFNNESLDSQTSVAQRKQITEKEVQSGMIAETSRTKRKQHEIDEPTDTYTIEECTATLLKNQLVAQNGEHRIPSTKSSKKPCLSIEQIDNNDNKLYDTPNIMKKILGNITSKTLQKNRSTIEDRYKSSKEDKSDPLAHKSLGEHKKTENYHKTMSNSYGKYLDQEFKDEILRKDIPCGKRFKKATFAVPTRILKMDDFIL